MTVEQTADQLHLVIQGIVEVLEARGLIVGREAELAEVQEAAVADITSRKPDAHAVRRFQDWAINCAKQGGNAAFAALVTAAANGLTHDVEAWANAIHP